MRKDKYKSSIINASWSGRVSLIINITQAISILLLLAIMVQMKTTVQTILVPPVINRPLTVEGDTMDKHYAEEMGRYFSQLFLTYTSKNVKAQYDAVLKYINVNVHADYQAKLYADARRISRNSISSVFHLLTMQAEKLKNDDYRVIVGGELKGMVGTQVVSDSVAYFEFVFSFKGGSLSIVSFNKVIKSTENNEDVFLRKKEEVDNNELENN